MPKEKVLLSQFYGGTRTGTQELADIVKTTRDGFKERVYLFDKRCFDIFAFFLMIIILSQVLLIPSLFLLHSFHSTLYLLFLTNLTKPFHERIGLKSWFKEGEKDRVKDIG